MLFRTRQMFVGQRTQMINALRGHLAEHGVREVKDAIEAGHATIVERLGRVTGYATGIGFMAHAVGEMASKLACEVRTWLAALPSITTVAHSDVMPNSSREKP